LIEAKLVEQIFLVNPIEADRMHRDGKCEQNKLPEIRFVTFSLPLVLISFRGILREIIGFEPQSRTSEASELLGT